MQLTVVRFVDRCNYQLYISRMHIEILKKAIDKAGGIRAVADEVELSYEAVRKWYKKGLPRTEWTGETQYAKAIASMTDGEFSEDDILYADKVVA